MKFIPNYISKEYKSNAEKKFYSLLLETESYNAWHCLHSLNIANHINKREGEIDFLLIGPDGIFVLEIKGGRVARKNGLWLFTDRYGSTNRKKESPFNQAKSAFYSLRSDIEDRFGDIAHQIVMGYGVVFPDIEFDEVSPEWSNDIVYDRRDNEDKVDLYLNRLIAYWSDKQRSRKKLSNKEITEIVNYLRGDFEKIAPLADQISNIENEQIVLTNKQYEILDALESNPRTIFLGGAGTGKTLLALEQLKRNSQKGIKTLFLCFNKLLADYINEVINKSTEYDKKFINAKSFHKYMYELVVKDEKLKIKLEQSAGKNDYFSSLLPEVFSMLKDQVKYEYLIVDEMQDLLSEPYLKAISGSLSSGLENSNWLICMDIENQNIYSGSNKVADWVYHLGTVYKLNTNCRNTKQIADQTEAITSIDAGKTKSVNGKAVKYLYFNSDSEQAENISEYITKLTQVDLIAPENIVILSPRARNQSLAGSGRLRISYPLYELGSAQSSMLKLNGHISFGTIASYKGLESSVVILTDIHKLNDETNKRLNYIGYTRARSQLTVSLDSSLRKEVAELFSEYINRKLQ